MDPMEVIIRVNRDGKRIQLGMVTPKFNKAGMYNLFIKKGTERERNQNIL